MKKTQMETTKQEPSETVQQRLEKVLQKSSSAIERQSAKIGKQHESDKAENNRKIAKQEEATGPSNVLLKALESLVHVSSQKPAEAGKKYVFDMKDGKLKLMDSSSQPPEKTESASERANKALELLKDVDDESLPDEVREKIGNILLELDRQVELEESNIEE